MNTIEKQVFIAGAGGMGRVIYDFLIKSGKVKVTGFFDDNPKYYGKKVCGIPVFKLDELNTDNKNCEVLLGILDPISRKNFVQRIKEREFPLLEFHSDSAIISPYARIGKGCSILDFSFVMNNAQISDFVHVHFNCAIGHDVVVGAYSTVAPSCIIGGYAKIGEGVKLGMGVKVLPGIEIGDYAVIGANSLVTKNLSANSISFGSPAKEVSSK
jgi:sugar O-acyltransferase (sialic acid O-acetyltransferase NeuD family)